MLPRLMLLTTLIIGNLFCNNQEETETIPADHATFNEIDLEAIAQISTGRVTSDFNACTLFDEYYGETPVTFNAAAQQFVNRYEAASNARGIDAQIRDALRDRSNPEVRQQVIEVLAGDLADRSSGSLFSFLSDSGREQYRRFCNHRGYSHSRVVRPPLMDIGSKQHLLEIIRGVALPESVTCPDAPPPVEPPPPTPIFMVASLDRNFISQGTRNASLTISGEGVNLPTNEDGTLNTSVFSAALVNLDTGNTITISNPEIINPVTLADFPNYYEFGVRLSLPNDLELGHYRIIIQANSERIGANSTQNVHELFEVRRSPAKATLPPCTVFPIDLQPQMRAAGRCRLAPAPIVPF